MGDQTAAHATADDACGVDLDQTTLPRNNFKSVAPPAAASQNTQHETAVAPTTEVFACTENPSNGYLRSSAEPERPVSAPSNCEAHHRKKPLEAKLQRNAGRGELMSYVSRVQSCWNRFRKERYNGSGELAAKQSPLVGMRARNKHGRGRDSPALEIRGVAMSPPINCDARRL